MPNERYDKRTDRPEDHDYFNQYAKIILPRVKGKVLDIGCGQGWLTKSMCENAESIDAYDKYNKQPAENKDPKITYIKKKLPCKFSGFYDTIISTEFIEHITKEDLEILLENIKEVGIRFLGSTPNVPQHSGNPYHLQEYSVGELRDLFAKHGFTGDFYTPLPFLTVWDVWLAS